MRRDDGGVAGIAQVGVKARAGVAQTGVAQAGVGSWRVTVCGGVMAGHGGSTVCGGVMAGHRVRWGPPQVWVHGEGLVDEESRSRVDEKTKCRFFTVTRPARVKSKEREAESTFLFVFAFVV